MKRHPGTTKPEKKVPAPGPRERALREAVERIPPFSTRGCESSERTWREHVNEMRDNILNEDPSRFLDWWVVRHTMYTCGHSEWIAPMLAHLQERGDWQTRWKPALREPDVGNPVWYAGDLCTSEAAISYAYFLARFEELTGTRLDEYATIFEFGGGYGGPCRMAHDLGFSGQYILYDFAVVLALAKYYLYESGYGDITLLSGSDETFLDAMLDGAAEGALFLSTWALSETPAAMRGRILDDDPFGAYLVTYQNQFREMDNIAFFSKWMDERWDVDWRTWAYPGGLAARGIAGVRRAT